MFLCWFLVAAPTLQARRKAHGGLAQLQNGEPQLQLDQQGHSPGPELDHSSQLRTKNDPFSDLGSGTWSVGLGMAPSQWAGVWVSLRGSKRLGLNGQLRCPLVTPLG